MLKTFAHSRRLRNAYLVNSIIWSLKSIPLVRRLLPASLYASRGLKRIARVISTLLGVLGVFVGKALYLLVLWVPLSLAQAAPTDSFVHTFILFSLIGGFMNTSIFNPSKDKFYAIFLLRIDAKQYVLTDYLFFLLRIPVGMLPFSLLLGRMVGLSPITCLLFPLFTIFVKLCFTALDLYRCKKQKKIYNENRLTNLTWFCVGLLLLLSALPYIGFSLPEKTLWLLSAALAAPSALAFRYIWHFDAYRPIYQELLRPESFASPAGKGAVGAAQQLALQKKMEADFSQTSNKSGYPYFQELFMKRHARLLTRSAKRIALASLFLFSALLLAIVFFPQMKQNINRFCLNGLPYFLFIMYFVNRGRTITQAMFFNCDHSMLAYRFYRQPKAILSLFAARLKDMVRINLIPALVIALGLPVLLYATGGTAQILNYVVLFVTILAMSVFFSVHSMVLYYLLQPYNINLESKSAAFQIVDSATYFVCYFFIQIQLPTLYFGAAVSAFCAVYTAVALALAYRRAPKTFRLRL